MARRSTVWMLFDWDDTATWPPDYTTVLVEVYGLSRHAHVTATFISNPCGEQGPVWAFSCSIENVGRPTTEAVKHAPQVRAWTPIPN